MGTFMKKADFKGMSVDELWALYEKVSAEIAAKIIIEQKCSNVVSLRSGLRLRSSAKLLSRSAGRIQRSFQSFEIQTIPRKLGQGGVSNHAGF